MHSDQGQQFESELMNEHRLLWEIDKTHTAPYRHQASGVCECINRVLGNALRSLLAHSEVYSTSERHYDTIYITIYAIYICYYRI